MAAQRELASRDGVFLEASSVITAAVLPELIARGEVAPEQTVVLLGTSTGLKDVPTSAERLPAVPVIAPELVALDAAIAR
jgi:threonine synthase